LALFKKRNLNPEQKAKKAQTNIGVRVLGAGLLVYFIYKLFTQQPPSELTWWQILIGVVMALLAVGIIALTVAEFIRNNKMGVYKPDFWDEEGGEGTGESAPAPKASEKPWNTPEMMGLVGSGEETDEADDAPENDENTETSDTEE
jgi:hypothetical protein